jgi:hypothetical protein
LFDTIKFEQKYDFRNRIIGKYYCYEIDENAVYSDSSKILKIITKKYYDTITVSLANDYMILVKGYILVLYKNYEFSDGQNAQGFSFSGYFRNDSIFFGSWTIWGDSFNIKGRKM